ncbi:hypothetical protein [Nocardia sp. NBC_00511]|uniref:hypothetical protein n=1 Tax=Nocardia sp. NBC_00511 TaxID=2903591 RepID=UPI002F91B20C
MPTSFLLVDPYTEGLLEVGDGNRELFAPFLRVAAGLGEVFETELRQDIAARAADILKSTNQSRHH